MGLNVKIKLAITISSVGAAGSASRIKFEADFSKDVAAKLQITVDRVVVNSITAGSVVVDFSIRPDKIGAPMAVTAVTTVFSAPGVAIAGTTTSTPVLTAFVVNAQAPQPPPPPAAKCSTLVACLSPKVKDATKVDSNCAAATCTAAADTTTCCKVPVTVTSPAPAAPTGSGAHQLSAPRSLLSVVLLGLVAALF